VELATGLTGRYPLHAAVLGWELVPDTEVTGWRAACECGRRGGLQRTGDRSSDVGSPDDVEAATHDQWLVHVAPLRAARAVRLCQPNLAPP